MALSMILLTNFKLEMGWKFEYYSKSNEPFLRLGLS